LSALGGLFRAATTEAAIANQFLGWGGGRVALGLTDTDTEKGVLEHFATYFKAATYKAWDNRRRPDLFMQDLDAELQNPDNRIYVNLTGIVDNDQRAVWTAVMKGARGPRGGYTNYELWYIKTHPEIWGRVSFWTRQGSDYTFYKTAKELFNF
jgi:hypothetical protein